jgi:hypothetical protein
MVPISLHLLSVALLLLALGALHEIRSWPAGVDRQQTFVLGSPQLAAGTEAAVRVAVQELPSGDPIAGASVRIGLAGVSGADEVLLFEGLTDESGSTPARFRVPQDLPPAAEIVIETSSSVGHDRITQRVTAGQPLRLLLSSDKPLYQPGQQIHLRLLALGAVDGRPAGGETVELVVQDPGGNKVFRKSLQASRFGVAAADFTLAEQTAHGRYTLLAAVGAARAQQGVEVRPYTLPRFSVHLATERGFYLPGQRVEGMLRSEYFYGKPVASAELRLSAGPADAESVVQIDGRTDSNGVFRFGFDLPEAPAGPLPAPSAAYLLSAQVIDASGHLEQALETIPIAGAPLVIEAMPESGRLAYGLENKVYIRTSYPDGRPAPATLLVRKGFELPDGAPRIANSRPEELHTDASGWAELLWTPRGSRWGKAILDVTAHDAAGVTARESFRLDRVSFPDGNLLLRPDRAVYAASGTMRLEVFSDIDSKSVYLDVSKAGQIVRTLAAPLRDGRAELLLRLEPELHGTLELHAYVLKINGELEGDTRLVVVESGSRLSLDVSAKRDVHRPGETATLRLQAARADGTPLSEPAAIGVAVVDESVYALRNEDVAQAHLHFLLARELLEPEVRLHGFTLPSQLPSGDEAARLAQDRAASAAWARVPEPAAPEVIDTYRNKYAAIFAVQAASATRVATAALVALILIPVVMFAVVASALRRAGQLSRALRFTLTASLVILAMTASTVLVIAGFMALGWLLNGVYLAGAVPGWAGTVVHVALLFLAFLSCCGCLAAIVVWTQRWERSERAASGAEPAPRARTGLITLLVLHAQWLLALYVLVGANAEGATIRAWLIGCLLAAEILIPVAYVLAAEGLDRQGRPLVATVGGVLGYLMLFAAISPLWPNVLANLLGPSMKFPPSRGPASGMEMGTWQLWESRPTILSLLVPRDRPVTDAEPAAESPPELPGEPGLSTAAAPRVRQLFPETLYWAPHVVTDAQGSATLNVPLADSITSWRLTALASTLDGRLGTASRQLRVFQEFFVDVELPSALTVGDEIAVPVSVFNHLPQAQQVRLVVEPGAWFELRGPAELSVQVAPKDVGLVRFPIRALRPGVQRFEVAAYGEAAQDAIRRDVRVEPDGLRVQRGTSDRLAGRITSRLELPDAAIPGTPAVEVKLYPGILAQLVEGLETLLRVPYG